MDKARQTFDMGYQAFDAFNATKNLFDIAEAVVSKSADENRESVFPLVNGRIIEISTERYDGGRFSKKIFQVSHTYYCFGAPFREHFIGCFGWMGSEPYAELLYATGPDNEILEDYQPVTHPTLVSHVYDLLDCAE